MALAIFVGNSNSVMKDHCPKFVRACVASSVIGLASLATGHPGPPGHYHPDEIDEFDQVAMVSPAASQGHFDLGGTLVLAGIGACLAFAFFQKDSGIWKDATAKH